MSNVGVLEWKLPSFSGPSRVRRWAPAVSKSVLGLNESGYPQLLIDCLHCVCLYLLWKHNKTTREFYQERPFSTNNDKSYVNQQKCHIFYTWSEVWLEHTCKTKNKHGTWQLHRPLLNWLLDQVRTFWPILVLLALVPTWHTPYRN